MSASARTLVARSEESFMLLLQTVPDAMVLSDRDGRMILVNQHTERLFGYRQAQLIGKKVEILLPVRLRARHRRHRADYCKNPTVRAMGALGELAARRKDGSEFPVEICLSPVEIEGKMFIWSAIRDVTERHKLITNLRTA